MSFAPGVWPALSGLLGWLRHVERRADFRCIPPTAAQVVTGGGSIRSHRQRHRRGHPL